MHRLIIKNFGPITDCDIQINDFMLLIGAQASGKSTISKLVFFFLNIRDEVIQFLISEAESEKSQVQLFGFKKQITRRFVEFWGPTPQNKDLLIRYDYSSGIWIEIKLDNEQHKFITPSFSSRIALAISESYSDISSVYKRASSVSLFDSSTQKMHNEVEMKLKQHFGELFDFNRDLLFIPAGRSLLSILSDQLQFINPHSLDYPMMLFIEKINATKSFFNKSIDDIILERQVLSNSQIWFSAIRKTRAIIKKILKGEYVHGKDGDRLTISPSMYIKMNYVSSGQQESVWILLSLFLIVLDKVNALVFIEEPEAHLFPDAQKDLIELICFLANELKCGFFITTHSPYILSSINNHLYAYIIGQHKQSEAHTVIDKSQWLNPSKVSSFLVDSGMLSNIIDEEMGLIKAEMIDGASERINREFDTLFALEN